jgi:hypothetical protein
MIVSKLILTNFKYTEIFISSIFSKGWLAFILNKNIPLTYLPHEKKWKTISMKHNQKIIKPESFKNSIMKLELINNGRTLSF